MSEPVVPWSKLLQQPNKVVSLLEEAVSVTLARRDAEDLVLTKASSVRSQAGSVLDITRVMAALVRVEGGEEALRAAAPEAFPWVRIFPQDGVDEFVAEFVAMARACAELGGFGPLDTVVAEWRNTAEIEADPELAAALSRPFPEGFPDVDGGPVPRPEVPDESEAK